ncbi:MAG: formate/nitrite transporter family protein [Carnobacterium sp.]|uniref:formate/nitrite transporter family protein n=1 Tax=Carnobacterium sp. TaxID=48221 RepID=UPI002FC8F9D8
MYTPEEIMVLVIATGQKKIKKTLQAKWILGFLGGALIALGYLGYVRVAAPMIEEWGSLATFIGACVFPIGLILILLGGGELVTGNIMAVSLAWWDKKVTTKELLKNWAVITAANLIGAVAVAYVFGHVLGLTSAEPYLQETILIAQAKISAHPLEAFLSGIGANWFVGMSLWLCYGAKDSMGKIMGVWFPVMTFVAIGFQHSVANMFIIPAAIFEGGATWSQFIANVVPVYLGNVVGGAIFVSLFYYQAYHQKAAEPLAEPEATLHTIIKE